MSKPEGTYFSVHFDKKGEVIQVEGPDGVVDAESMDESPINSVNKLDAVLVGHKPGHSPCCVICGNHLYCWC